MFSHILLFYFGSGGYLLVIIFSSDTKVVKNSGLQKKIIDKNL